MDDSETSDFDLKCGSKTFRVHKNILGARSSVFKAMFQYGMKEAVINDVMGRPLELVRTAGCWTGLLENRTQLNIRQWVYHQHSS